MIMTTVVCSRSAGGKLNVETNADKELVALDISLIFLTDTNESSFQLALDVH